MQNLMDSHDTDRLVSMAHNPDRPYNKENRPQTPGVHYDNGKPPETAYRRARLAALLQMTYVGAPMIYYGDEAGMWGASDPTCRKPMLWQDLEPYEKPEENHVMTEHLAYYQEVIALRNEHPALRSGTFRELLCDNELDVWAFLRADDAEQLVVVLNPSEQQRQVDVPLPGPSPRKWRVVHGDGGSIAARAGVLKLAVPPIAGLVLHAALT
jgi:glycosidase